ncbi:MAG TPA: MFS transporter [Solirubrobacteraceae bacterium]|nr:MFS transporter [Solirubrobacteraceae bacterium]
MSLERPRVSARYRWVVLFVGALGAGAFSVLRMGLPALSPALRDAYGLSLPQVGLLLSAVALGVMLTLVPWGMLTDRIGERPVLALGLAGTGAAVAAAAFAPGYPALLAGLLAAGMLGASTTGASGRAVMGWFARDQRGLALGIRQMALPLGGAIGSLTLPWIAGEGGVRAALLSIAGLAFVAAVAAAAWMRDAPPPPPGALALAAGPGPTRDPRMWRLGAASALLVVGQSALLGFIVLFLHDERGLSAALAAGALAALQAAGAAARLVAGRASDVAGARMPLLRRIAVADALLLGAVALLAAGPGALLYPVLAAAGVTAMCWNGLAFTAAAEIAGRTRAGTAVSLQNTIVAVGGALAPAAFGWFVHATSWSLGYAACAAAPVAAFVVLAPLVGDERARAVARERRLAAAGV